MDGWMGGGGEMTLGLADEQMRKQLTDQIAGLNTQAATSPQMSGVAVGPPPAPTTGPAEPSMLQKFAPAMAGISAGFLKGGPLQGASEAVAGMTQAQAIGRQRQKILDLLSGTTSPGAAPTAPSTTGTPGAGGAQGFQGGPTLTGKGGIETLGLTPEQTTGLYNTAEAALTTQRDWPLRVMSTVGELYNRVMVGDYHSAQIPLIQTQIENMKAQTQSLPYKNAAEIYDKIADMEQKLSAAAKAREETKALPTETARKKEEIAKSEYERGSLAQARKMEVTTAEPFTMHVNERNNITVMNKATGKVTGELPLKPAFTNADTQNAWKLAQMNFLQRAQKDIRESAGKDVEKAAKEWDALMITLGKDTLDHTAQAAILAGHLSPKNRELFTRVMTLFREGEASGVPIDKTQAYVNELMGTGAAEKPKAGLRTKEEVAAGKTAAPVKAGAAPAGAPTAAQFTAMGAKLGDVIRSKTTGKLWKYNGPDQPPTEAKTGAPAPRSEIGEIGGMWEPFQAPARRQPISLPGFGATEGKSWEERLRGK